jgi:tetratricopeptide (TPR) repeat protein
VKLLRLQRKIMLDAQSAQVIERKLAALEPRVDADLEKGIAAGYQRAAELDGDDWRLFNHWFQALMDSQQFAEAQRVAQTMTERFPQARASWRAMGQARMARTDPKGAREAFERALALYPDDAASRIGLKGLGKP